MSTRRQFLGRGLAAIAAAAVAPSVLSSCGGAADQAAAPVANDGKPNSKWGGVQIGTITYSWNRMPGGLENMIKYAKEANLSSLELMSSDLETFLGIPENPQNAWRAQMMAQMQQAPAGGAPAGGAPAGGPGGPGGPRPGAMQLTPEQQALVDQYNKDVVEFRKNVDMNKVAEAKKLFEDAGVGVHIVKFAPSRWSDDEIRYAFKVAKAMGAGAVTEELSAEAAERLAPFAKEAELPIAFHNHMQYAQEGFSCDPMLALNEYVMLNFDTGHYEGSTGKSAVAFIDKYHDRIYSIHLKDKTGPNTQPANTNQVWGQGETDLEGILTCLKTKYPNIYADIELEYSIAAWSNQVKETAKCAKYARQILI